MFNVRIAVSGLAVACLLFARPALAQVDTASAQPAGPPPPHLSIVDGTALVEHEGRAETAVANMPLLDGDRLRTEAGRVEVTFADGSVLHVDEHSTIDLLAPDLLRLAEGRVILIVAGADDPSRAVRYQVDSAAASVQTNAPGEYRISMADATVELAVERGYATLATDVGPVQVRAGEWALGRAGESPGAPQYYNTARSDPFDRWSNEQRDTRLGETSSRYLPDNLRSYSSSFDRYGSWSNDATYGSVWYPAVADDWRPYTDGYWGSYPSYGSFWIGYEPWSWPTHHFGRWGVSLTGRWFWIPTRIWGPAWVYWAINTDFVSWCPLGWSDYPVYGLWGVRGVFNYRQHDPWRGWTVVPRGSFGRRVSMARSAIDGRRLDDRVRTTFIAQRTSPRQYAVPRSAVGPSAESLGLPVSPRTGGAASRVYSDRFRSPGSEVNRPGDGGAVQPDRRAVGRFDRPGVTNRAPAPLGNERRVVPGAPGGAIRENGGPGRIDSSPGSPAPGGLRNPREAVRAPRFPQANGDERATAPGPRRDTMQPSQPLPRQEAPSARPRNEAPAPRSGIQAPAPRQRYDAPAAPPRIENPRRGSQGGMPAPSRAPGWSEPRSAPRYETGGSAPRNNPGASTPRYNPGASTPRYNPGASTPRYNPGASMPRYNPGASAPRYNPGASTPRYNPGASTPRYNSGSAMPRSSPGASAPRYNSGGSVPRYNSGGSAPRTSSAPQSETRSRGDARSSGSARPRGGGRSRQ